MLSFITPAYNEERCLPATLAAIHAAAKEIGIDYEIVVVNDASTDSTAGIAEQSGARVVHVEHRQISKTRNSGARAASGDRLVFVDADTRLNVPVLRAALAAMDAGAVGGGAAAVFEEDAPSWAHRLIGLTVGLMRRANWAAGCFIFCKREAFESAGGFDERHFAGEEIMLSIAMKRQGRFVILRESVTTSPRKFIGRTFWQILRLTIGLLLRGMSGVRSRDSTQFWYDGKR